MNQAERRFVTFSFVEWVGTALSADWMRPSRRFFYSTRRVEIIGRRTRKGFGIGGDDGIGMENPQGCKSPWATGSWLHSRGWCRSTLRFEVILLGQSWKSNLRRGLRVR